MKRKASSSLLLAILVAAGALAAGCGTRIDPGAPVVTYYYVPG
jgi:hypothetical protein